MKSNSAIPQNEVCSISHKDAESSGWGVYSKAKCVGVWMMIHVVVQVPALHQFCLMWVSEV